MTAFEPQALPHSLAAPGLARRYLATRAEAWPFEMLELATLLTSELVTNAVQHGRGPVELLLSEDSDRLHIEVGDSLAGGLPHAPGRPPDIRQSGRGLLIVDQLADRWGFRPRNDPPGKVVWFELQHRPVTFHR